MTIRPKTESELGKMREGGQKLNEVLSRSNAFITSGKSLQEIDLAIEAWIDELGGKPSFKNYRGYPASACLSVNAVIIHGIPTDYILKEGDVVGVDVGLNWEGYHVDAAYTKLIGLVDPKIQKLVRVAQSALREGITVAIAGNIVGDIGLSIEQYVSKQGNYGIIRDFTGHGIGANLQEMPEIPNYANAEPTTLINGMTIAIEPMLSLGSPNIRILADRWSAETKDHSPSAHFESTIIINNADPEILVDFPLSYPVDQKDRLW